ncbi:MAG: hypothetical protein H7Z72_23515 [Bacteroidetes bacterium]|nr:hypothetical protein [Fibrella sp.]
MGTNLPEQHMLDQTLDAFANGDLPTMPPAQAGALIDGWVSALQGDPNVEGIKQALRALNEQLQATQPDRNRIRDRLIDLAAQATDIAQGPYAEGTWTGKLERLAKILDHSGRSL